MCIRLVMASLCLFRFFMILKKMNQLFSLIKDCVIIGRASLYCCLMSFRFILGSLNSWQWCVFWLKKMYIINIVKVIIFVIVFVSLAFVMFIVGKFQCLKISLQLSVILIMFRIMVFMIIKVVWAIFVQSVIIVILVQLKKMFQEWVFRYFRFFVKMIFELINSLKKQQQLYCMIKNMIIVSVSLK